MRNNSRSKKIGKKIRTNLRARQKIAPKVIAICSVVGVVSLISLVMAFNFTGINNTKADPIDIRQVEDQVFSIDISLPASIINHQKKAQANTIFIQTKKYLQQSSTIKHE